MKVPCIQDPYTPTIMTLPLTSPTSDPRAPTSTTLKTTDRNRNYSKNNPRLSIKPPASALSFSAGFSDAAPAPDILPPAPKNSIGIGETMAAVQAPIAQDEKAKTTKSARDYKGFVAGVFSGVTKCLGMYSPTRTRRNSYR